MPSENEPPTKQKAELEKGSPCCRGTQCKEAANWDFTEFTYVPETIGCPHLGPHTLVVTKNHNLKPAIVIEYRLLYHAVLHYVNLPLNLSFQSVIRVGSVALCRNKSLNFSSTKLVLAIAICHQRMNGTTY